MSRNTLSNGIEWGPKEHKMSVDKRISSVFDSVITMMKICGILWMERQNIFIVILHSVFCILTQLISFVANCRYIGAFLIGYESNNGLYNIGVFSFIWFYLLTGYMSFVCFINSKQVNKFCARFNSYQIQYGIHFDTRKYDRIIRIIVAVFLVQIIVGQVIISVSFIYGMIDLSSMYGSILWPWHTTTGVTFVTVVIGFGFCSAIPMMNCMLMLVFYALVLKCVGKEFENVSSRLTNLQDKQTSIIAKDFEDIRQQHQAVVNVLSSANPILRHVAGGFYAMGIPVICCMIFGFASGSLVFTDVLKLMATVLLNVFSMFSTTFLGAAVNIKAHEALEILQNFDLSSLPDNVIGQISVFTNRLSGPPIGVSVYGLFTIDYPSVLMLFGTLSTYAVIAIQFTSGLNTNNAALLQNATNTTYL